jgi:ppGpp synthetase/RelA/SpoT-type nucleotidyltranferase
MTVSDKDKLLLHEMEQVARVALEALVRTIEASPIKGATYAIRSRVKAHDSAVRKIEDRRRRAKKAKGPQRQYGPGDLTDVIGVRLVTPYRVDMVDVLKLVCNLIDGPNHHAPFQRGMVTEAQIFVTPASSSKDEFDPSSVEEQALALLAERFPEIKPKRRDETYSGLHILAMLDGPERAKRLRPYVHGIPVEIQIRSVFEDAWAEVDHFACYKNDTLKGGDDRKTEIENRVELLKKLVDTAAGHADIIKGMRKESLERPPGGVGPGAFTKSLSSGSEIASMLAQFGIGPEVSDPIAGLLERRGEIFAKSPTSRAETEKNTREFLTIADGLLAVQRKQLSPSGWLRRGGDAAIALDYALKMEAALTYLYAETPEAVERAVELYEIVEATQPKSYAARYRLGHALAKQRKTDAAIDRYKDALRLMERRRLWTERERRILGIEQKPGLKWRTQKLLGYQYYQKSLHCDPNKNAREKADYLRRAFEITAKAEPACDEPPQQRSITNNLLYYAVEYLELERQHLKSARGLGGSRELRIYVKKAQQYLAMGDAPPAHYDTVAYVADYLGMGEVALAAAREILNMLPSEESDAKYRYPVDEVRTMVSRARSIQKKYARPALPSRPRRARRGPSKSK